MRKLTPLSYSVDRCLKHSQSICPSIFVKLQLNIYLRDLRLFNYNAFFGFYTLTILRALDQSSNVCVLLAYSEQLKYFQDI